MESRLRGNDGGLLDVPSPCVGNNWRSLQKVEGLCGGLRHLSDGPWNPLIKTE
jgi:hypothetical protein